MFHVVVTSLRRRALLTSAAAVGTGGLLARAGAAGRGLPANPLATTAQQRLDARALAIWAANDFRVEAAAVRAAFLAGHGSVPSQEALDRLDNAIDELALGMLMTATNHDPFRPAVHWLGAAAHRWFGLDLPGSRWAYDNPDTIYRTVPIDPESTYVVHGRLRRAGTADLAFSLVDDLITQTTVAYADGHRLRSRSDPEYRITIGPDAPRGRRHHLQTTERTQQLFIRSTVSNWVRHRPDELSVSRTSGPPAPPPRTDDEIAAETRTLLTRGGPVFGAGLLGFKTMRQPVNTMSEPGVTPGALVSQANAFGHFRLTDDEALVIRMNTAGAAYATLPVTDPWMVSVDPGGHQSSLNDQQAVRDRDGMITFVVSPADPAVANWVSTAGRHEGTIMARWQRLGTAKPALSTQVVPLADLPSALPSGTPQVSPAERSATLSARRSAYLRRFRDR